MTLKVGIVGAGSVGKAIGGHVSKTLPVTYGVRDTSKYADLAKLPNCTVASVPETVKASDVVILATTSAHTDDQIREVAASLGPEISGKVLIDATNPLSKYPALEVRWDGKSGGEVLAEALPNTHVYKAFNTLGVEHMVAPDGARISGEQLTLLVAGGPEGREAVEQVVAAAGFKPTWVGGIRYARNLEAIAELWIHLAVPGVGTADKWGRDFHFQVIRK